MCWSSDSRTSSKAIDLGVALVACVCTAEPAGYAALTQRVVHIQALSHYTGHAPLERCDLHTLYVFISVTGRQFELSDSITVSESQPANSPSVTSLKMDP